MTGQQLKNSILQMAVQGKLVPQDPNDEPASVLLERIRAEKEKLIKEGKIKKEKNLSVIFRGADNLPYEKIGKNEPVCIADEVPFEIPESWEWVRLGTISTYAETKKKVNAQNVAPDLWELDLEDIEKGGRIISKKTVGERKAVGDKTVFNRNDILYSKLRPYLLKILVAPDDGICTSEIVPFSLYGTINTYYIVAFLKSPYVDQVINSVTYGVKMPRVGTETMTSLLVPLPPISEQARIVAKLKCVSPKVQSYSTAYEKGEKLTAEFPIQLKKSILQYAVQGKLVPQDSADEPAGVLLEHIRAEKEQLIKSGKIKRDKHESVIFRRDNSYYERVDGMERCIDDEIPFEIPESWEWGYLGNIAFVTKLAGFEYTKYIAPALQSNGIPLFKGKNIQNGHLIESFESYIPDETSDNLWRSQITKKCLLTPYVGTIGNIAIFDGNYKAHLGSNVGKIEMLSSNILEEYVLFYLRSEYGYKELTKFKKATAQESISIEAIRNVRIAIPPFCEQKRIVKKLNIIMSRIM